MRYRDAQLCEWHLGAEGRKGHHVMRFLAAGSAVSAPRAQPRGAFAGGPVAACQTSSGLGADSVGRCWVGSPASKGRKSGRDIPRDSRARSMKLLLGSQRIAWL